MGNNVQNEKTPKNENMALKQANNIEIINRNSFNFITLIGIGGFSKVWEVKWKKNGKIFALKEMLKARIIDRKLERAILAERDILSKIRHPFIINLHFSFQDNDKLYLVVDLAKGKDLKNHLNHLKQMTEEQTRFVVGCIILGLEYLHYHKIVHRDIKPENIIFDEKGYAKITDFGVANYIDKINSKETPGTYSYMAPEILFKEPTNLSLDYYSLGIIVYELMKGIKPYIEFDAKNTRKYLSENQFSMKRHAVPEGWGIESADFINRLLLKNPNVRLGASGIKELKNHCWFRGFNFQDLYEFKIESPFDVKIIKKPIFVPEIDKETHKRYKKIMISPEYKTVFKNYSYFNLYDPNLSKEFLENPQEKLNEKKNNNIINDKISSTIEKINSNY